MKYSRSHSYLPPGAQGSNVEALAIGRKPCLPNCLPALLRLSFWQYESQFLPCYQRSEGAWSAELFFFGDGLVMHLCLCAAIWFGIFHWQPGSYMVREGGTGITSTAASLSGLSFEKSVLALVFRPLVCNVCSQQD